LSAPAAWIRTSILACDFQPVASQKVIFVSRPVAYRVGAKSTRTPRIVCPSNSYLRISHTTQARSQILRMWLRFRRLCSREGIVRYNWCRLVSSLLKRKRCWLLRTESCRMCCRSWSSCILAQTMHMLRTSSRFHLLRSGTARAARCHCHPS